MIERPSLVHMVETLLSKLPAAPEAREQTWKAVSSTWTDGSISPALPAELSQSAVELDRVLRETPAHDPGWDAVRATSAGASVIWRWIACAGAERQEPIDTLLRPIDTHDSPERSAAASSARRALIRARVRIAH